MAKGRSAAKPVNRRGSPEAIEKRRAARLFNDVLGGRSAGAKLDGRTDKRRRRLLEELESGRRGQRDLKPIEVLQHVDELLALGEPLSALRKVVKPRKVGVAPEALVDVVTRLHKAYGFRPEVYRFVGLADDVLQSAGVMAAEPSRRARPRRRAAS